MKQTKRLAVMLIAISLLTSALGLSASAAQPTTGASSVAITALNVRSDADTSAPVTATLRENDVAVVLDTVDDTWYHINYNGTVGYVAAMYMTELRTTERFSAGGTVTNDHVTMRSSPSMDAAVVDTYTCGTVMYVTGISDGWYEVSYGSNTGYIRCDLMDVSCAADAVPADAAFSLNEEIVDYAMQFVGYRYIYGASSPTVGFDCSGLTYYVYGKFGYSISRTASQQYRNNGVSVSRADLKPGDLLFFSSNGGRSVTHVGMYIGGGRFVHASTSTTGVIISDLTSSYYTRVWFGAKRIV